MSKNYSKETLCIRGGYEPEIGEPMSLPIVQSTTFRYKNPDEVADLFDLKTQGHMYSRISNPTVEAFEKKITQLEGGVGSVATSSGQSATLLAVLNICKAGQNIISSSSLYGGTYNLFNITLRNLGIETRFINQDDSEEEILKLVDENTKLIFGEILSNPGLSIFDFEKFSSISKKSDIPLIIDNTVATPYLCNPFNHGANIIIHSTSKYIDGHATALGGVVVDGGNFNWDNDKFSELVEPDPSYHGIKYVESFKESAYITKLRVSMLRDLGSCMSPFNAFLSNQGLETLHLRMERHSSNALTLAKYLQNHEKVSWVNYPKLNDNNNLSSKYLEKGTGGILTFGIKGGVKEAKEFIKNLELVDLAVHLGFNKTSVLHPASTTHSQLSEEEQLSCNVTPDMIRVSVGIENIEDLIKDFDNSLGQIKNIKSNSKNIGILNLMPNKIETQCQLLQLLNFTKENINVKFIKLKSYKPKNVDLDYLNINYEYFDDIKDNLDGIIITGAPVETLDFKEVKYINELNYILDYCKENIKSSICICWSAQAALNHYYGVRKETCDKKIFGVYNHDILDQDNILKGISQGFKTPHSRYTRLIKEDLYNCNDIKVLCITQSKEDHIIKGKFNDYYILGHCEYDKDCLRREYNRDINLNRPIDIPVNYFKNNNPEEDIVSSWEDTSIKLYKNWINNL